MILKIIKKLVFAILIIYGLDLLIQNLGIFVPLNLVTIFIVSTLGFPGLISLALSFFFLI
ncbi:MAG: pro-sigmaK processing inhibitor BofA family protein [Bacilli bacterium]|nr:pro-sigmaK processing inhibitor BofA family protein [Bacilli bacterium]MDD4795142.1 pro-sigmaK processing inhibitor BofA family protein [Bacilli bacterium]